MRAAVVKHFNAKTFLQQLHSENKHIYSKHIHICICVCIRTLWQLNHVPAARSCIINVPQHGRKLSGKQCVAEAQANTEREATASEACKLYLNVSTFFTLAKGNTNTNTNRPAHTQTHTRSQRYRYDVALQLSAVAVGPYTMCR